MSDDDDAPETSPEERELIELQTDMLREARQREAQQQELQRMMAPILMQEAGYDVETAESDVKNPKFLELKKDIQKLEKRIDKKQKNIKDTTNRTRKREMQRELEEFAAERDRLEEQRDKMARYETRAGDIIGLTEAEPTEQEQLREELETEMLERELAAARGELPVNPALMSSLEEQEESLRAQLERNLGAGYETSTPGIEALADFEQRREEILENARRGDLTMAQQLANQMGQFESGMRGQDIGIGQTAIGRDMNPLAISQAVSNPLGFMQNERWNQFQANNRPSTEETLGLMAAGYFTGGLSGAAGAGLANLFMGDGQQGGGGS